MRAATSLSSTITQGYLRIQALGSGLTGYVEISQSGGHVLTAEPITPAGFAQTDMVFSQLAEGAFRRQRASAAEGRI